MSLLEVQHLSVGFRGANGKPDKIAVDDVSFKLEAGKVLGVVGESGSGKSVTALSVLGLLPYPKAYHSSQSSIKFEGRELIGADEKDLQRVRGADISFIFQEPMSSLNPLHRIGKQIGETLRLHSQLSEKEIKKEVLSLLKMTGIKNAKERMNAYPFELSGGQRQRVMIAMAIANKPKILIADEPTTALDVTIQAQIIDLLMNLRKKLGMSIVFISHDLRLVRKIADQIVVMKDGKIVEQGSTESIFNAPKASYTKTLINSNSILKNINNLEKNLLLSVRGARVSFPLKKNFWGKVINEVKAVDNISFDLYEGETLGVVGESGSGKTTLGMAIVDLIKAKGSIVVKDNKKQIVKKESKSFRQIVQIVFQDPYNSLNPRMNIEQIVAEGLEVHRPDLNACQKRELVTKSLKQVGLDADVLDKYPHEFSGGQRQRIAIARALVLEPKILVLDEPTSALDVTIQAQIIDLLQKIQKEKELSYIFISHDMRAVRAMSDRIAVMKEGRFVEVGGREQIFKMPREDYTKALIAASI